MRLPLTLSAAALSSALLLAACDPKPAVPPKPPKPITQASGSSPLATMGAAGDTSVPRADTVLSTTEDSPKAVAAAAAATTAASGTGPTRNNRQMTRAEESAAMPMAGQNNDHSAPAAASAPSRAPSLANSRPTGGTSTSAKP